MSYLRSYATRDAVWGAGDGAPAVSGAGYSRYHSAAGSHGARRSDLLTGEDLGPPLMDPGEILPPVAQDPSLHGCMSSLQMTTLIAKVDALQAENMRLRDQLLRSQDKLIRDTEQVRMETNLAVEAARERAGERCEAAMSRLRLQAEALRKQNSQLSAQVSTHASKNRELVAQLQAQKIEASRKLREERQRLRLEAEDREKTFFGSLKTERDNLFEENEVLKREICSATGESREALEEDLRRSLFSEEGWSLECLARVRKAFESGGSGRSGRAGLKGRDGIAPVGPVKRSPPPSPRAEARKGLELLKGNLSALIASVSALDEQRLSLEQGLLALREAGSSMDKAEGASMTSAVFQEALRQAEKYRTELDEAVEAKKDAMAQLERVSRDLDRARRHSEELKAELDSRAGFGAEHDALVEENMQLVSAKSELEQRLSEAEGKVSNLTLELMEATEQLEEERARRSGFDPFSLQKSLASDEVQALNRKLEDVTQQLRQAQRELAQSRAETSRLQAETNQLRGRLAVWGKWN